MQLFRRKPKQAPTGPRPVLMEDLHRTWRRARIFLLAAPLLVGTGWATGSLTGRTLTMPDDALRISAAGVHLDPLARTMQALRREGARTEESVAIYAEHVAPVEKVLRRRGVKADLARQMAWPLVEESYRNNIDVATVIAVVFNESNFRPRATSIVGARGLMQVMPSWAGYWKACGRDLYDIRSNLCYGTRILAYELERASGNERRALLGYNGCVTGSNTPNCHTYPDKIARVRRQVVAELNAARTTTSAGVAASR